MKLIWKTIPETVVGLLRELQLKNTYLLVTKDRKAKTYTWSNGATIHQLSEEQADWTGRMADAGMIRQLAALAVPNSGTFVGTFYKLTAIGRYCAAEGKIPALGFAAPITFQVRINNKVAKTYREPNGDLTRVLTHVTENSGGAYTVYTTIFGSPDREIETALAIPLFEVDKFEFSHHKPIELDNGEIGQIPVYKMVATYGWPIAEINDVAQTS